MKTQSKEKIITKTGKVQFKSGISLPEDTIKDLQGYYLAAVNRNIGGNWEDLQRDIMATFYHCISTNENPRHELCSIQWCFYKQKLEKGETFNHNDMKVFIRVRKEEE